MNTIAGQFLARIKRRWYLLTQGMWRGEYAMNYWHKDGSLAMLTSQNKCGLDKVWWKKK